MYNHHHLVTIVLFYTRYIPYKLSIAMLVKLRQCIVPFITK